MCSMASAASMASCIRRIRYSPGAFPDLHGICGQASLFPLQESQFIRMRTWRESIAKLRPLGEAQCRSIEPVSRAVCADALPALTSPALASSALSERAVAPPAHAPSKAAATCFRVLDSQIVHLLLCICLS